MERRKNYQKTKTVTSSALRLNLILMGTLISTGSLFEDEDPHVPLIGLYGNQFKCQTPTPPLYHRGNRHLSANHHILVNISLGQVTARPFNQPKSERRRTQGARLSSVTLFYTCLYTLFCVKYHHVCEQCRAAVCVERFRRTWNCPVDLSRQYKDGNISCFLTWVYSDTDNCLFSAA